MDLYDYIFHIRYEKAQQIRSTKENKVMFGEVFTPYDLVEEMLYFLPKEVFKNKNIRWLDPSCGNGAFMICLFLKLFKELNEEFEKKEDCVIHIVKNMLFMVDINKENIELLRSIFGNIGNIIENDYLSIDIKNQIGEIDIIIGNPPYQTEGLIKTPTNNELLKKKDGKMVWREFVHHSISYLREREKGYLLFFIPSLWMKNDFYLKDGIYEKIIKNVTCLQTYTNTETNRLFEGDAQTNTCICLSNFSEESKNIIFVKKNDEIVCWNKSCLSFLPTNHFSILQKVFHYIDKYGKFNVIKTKHPSKEATFVEEKDELNNKPHIKTCLIDKDTRIASITYEYSNKSVNHYEEQKLIFAHKMYGFPYLDITGELGVSNADSYILKGYGEKELRVIQMYFFTPLIRVIIDSVRYRMRFLEKYAFELIPNIIEMMKEDKKIEKIVSSKKNIDERIKELNDYLLVKMEIDIKKEKNQYRCFEE